MSNFLKPKEIGPEEEAKKAREPKICDGIIEEINKITNTYKAGYKIAEMVVDELRKENAALKVKLEVAEDTLEELKELCCPDQLEELFYIQKRKREDKQKLKGEKV